MKNECRNILAFVFVTASLYTVGCSSTRISSTFRNADANAPHAVLNIDDRTHVPLMLRAPIEVTIDGQPVADGALPSGTTQVRLSPGCHTLIHTGRKRHWTYTNLRYTSGGTPVNDFTFTPVNMEFTVDADKTYRIVFRLDYWVTSLGYQIDYEGWDNDDIAQWPKKNTSQRLWR